jgi:transcriptional regulator with XRE-family HTH domain
MIVTPAQVLKTLRLENHFEQSDVARCIGVHDTKIRRFELGAQEPTLSEVCALLVTFRTSFEALFSPLIEEIKAEVHARVDDYEPPTSVSHATANRGQSYQRLKNFLNRLHG